MNNIRIESFFFVHLLHVFVLFCFVCFYNQHLQIRNKSLLFVLFCFCVICLFVCLLACSLACLLACLYICLFVCLFVRLWVVFFIKRNNIFAARWALHRLQLDKSCITKFLIWTIVTTVSSENRLQILLSLKVELGNLLLKGTGNCLQ